jgi:hypothetical protein
MFLDCSGQDSHSKISLPTERITFGKTPNTGTGLQNSTGLDDDDDDGGGGDQANKDD